MIIFDYNPQFFRLHPEYTREELLNLQEDILVVISEGSDDIEKDLNSKMDRYHIHVILRECHDRKLVQREKLGYEVIKGNKVPVYRYFTS